MVHFTNKDSMRKRHYWRLDTKTITLYQNETGTKYYKEIQLSEILNIEVAKQPHPTDMSRGVMHCFEIRTANVDYFVGEEPVARKDGVPVVNPPESGLGAYLARGWETDIRRALMPVTPQSSGTTGSQQPMQPPQPPQQPQVHKRHQHDTNGLQQQLNPHFQVHERHQHHRILMTSLLLLQDDLQQQINPQVLFCLPLQTFSHDNCS